MKNKTVYGVGYLDGCNIKSRRYCEKTGKRIRNREYTIWETMLQRCYSEKFLKKFPTYKGCEVSERWHSFKNFCEDIKNIENYSEWKMFKIEKGKRNKWKLDKDSKVKGNKVYSMETCRFITSKENCSRENRQVRTTGKNYTGVSPKGKKVQFVNIKEFCETYNLNSGNVGSCINKLKGHKSVKGWTFE